jgi:phthiodiolone/phenolphthiodiolone dimycocerosates ketoreductase
MVAERDRDPEDFDFALFPCALLIHEDENVIDRALENPVLKWMTACWGRINQDDWEQEGLPAPRPGWHYAINLLPTTISDAERDEVLARTTRAHCEKNLDIRHPRAGRRAAAAPRRPGNPLDASGRHTAAGS